MRVLVGLVLALIVTSPAVAEPLRVQRLDDSFIDVYLEPPATGRAGLLVVFQGSECLSVDPDGDRFPFTLPDGVVRMDIQKYGVTPERQRAEDGTCPAEYLANNTIDGRVIDALTVLSWLRAEAPWWDGRLFVAGASEGATVAAVVGALAPETQGMILVNGSIGRPFREGWSDAVASAVTQQGGDAATVDQARSETAAAWDRARATPTVETYQGASNTLRWWRSIIDLRPQNLLLHLRKPVVLVQSEMDEMTPVVSARVAAARLAQTNPEFTYIELAGLNHGFRDAEGRPQYQQVLPRLDAALADQAARRR